MAEDVIARQGDVTSARGVSELDGWTETGRRSLIIDDVDAGLEGNGGGSLLLSGRDENGDIKTQGAITGRGTFQCETECAPERRGASEVERVRNNVCETLVKCVGVERDVEVTRGELNAEAQEFVPGQPVVARVGGRTGPLKLTVKIDGVAVEFLCDTGAESTILSRRCFDTLSRETQRKFQDCASTLTMPDGRETVSKGPVLCTMQVGDRTVCEVVFVAEIADYALLGWDAQLALGVRYDVAGVDLVGETRVRRVFNPVVRRVTATGEFTVPARSEMIVNGKFDVGDEHGDMLVGSVWDPGESGMIVARAVIRTDSGDCPVRLINLSDSPKLVKPGEVIAGVEEVDDLTEVDGSDELGAGEGLPSHLEDVLEQTVKEARLSALVAGQFRKFLTKHAKVFAANDADLGRTNLVEHHIDTGGAAPIRQAPRRIPIAQQSECDREVRTMLEQGVIEPGQSPWASPVVLVRKKDGSLRFCVDYRKLNTVTKFDAYPLPRIDETLEALGGAQWFTTLDLISGYWQVGLTPEARLKSAFCVRSGLYLWNVMPFGLCNAPSTFERLMETVLQGLQWSSCLVYLDDIVIFGRTEREMLDRMDEVFERLGKAGLKVKPRKCKFFASETNYLGHVIGRDGIRVSPEKVAAVKEWPVPECTTEVRSFLGTASYYRRFVAGFATIAAPLHNLTGKDVPFVWSPECQRAFDQLKDVLSRAPVLAFPVPGAKFVLDTDASDCGIGAVLSQLVPAGTDGDGAELFEERVLGYASRSLSVHEKRYCTTRKELLAVVWFMRYFRPYLYGQEFLVRTDHSSLQWICSFWEPEGQIARWLQIIGEYRFKVQHREGKKHANADGLSRQGKCKQCGKNVPDEAVEITEPIRCPERLVESGQRIVTKVRAVTLEPEWTPNQLAAWQALDKELLPVVEPLKAGRVPTQAEITSWPAVSKRLMADFERLKLVDGVVYRRWFDLSGNEARQQLLAPRQIRTKILENAHDGQVAGHYAVKQTLGKIREHFFWPGMTTDVRHYCRSCVICQQRRPAPKRPHHPLVQDRVGEPMQRLTVDILGFDKATPRGNRYILVMVDTLTKWAEAVAMPNETAETVAKVLVEHVVCRLGVPAQIHSDQGRQFEAELFQQMCDLLGIRKTRTTPLHPQSDGQTERLNRTLLDLLSKLAIDSPADWDTKLPFALAAYRSTPHSTTGETPNRLMLGREVNTPLRLLAPVAPDDTDRNAWVEQLHENFAEAHVRVQEHIGKAQRLQKTGHDRFQKGYSFVEGQRVWLMDTRSQRGVPRKLNPYRWKGPYVVRKRISAAVYLIAIAGGRSQVVNVDRLKPYVERQALDPGAPAVADDVSVAHGPENGEPDARAEEHVSDDEPEAGNDDQTPEVGADGRPDELAEVGQERRDVVRRRPVRARRPPRRFGAFEMAGTDGD